MCVLAAIENSLHVLVDCTNGLCVRQIRKTRKRCADEWRKESVDVLPSKNKTCRMHSSAKLNMQHKKLELLFLGSLFLLLLFYFLEFLALFFFIAFCPISGMFEMCSVLCVFFFFCAIQINSDNIQRRESERNNNNNQN